MIKKAITIWSQAALIKTVLLIIVVLSSSILVAQITITRKVTNAGKLPVAKATISGISWQIGLVKFMSSPVKPKSIPDFDKSDSYLDGKQRVIHTAV